MTSIDLKASGYATLTFGARLRIAREQRNMNLAEAAASLCLPTHILEQFEIEDYAHIEHAPPPAFLRGYLRNYARLLDIPDEETHAALAASGLAIETSNMLSASLQDAALHAPRRNSAWLHWFTGAILAILVVLVITWWNTHPRNETLTIPEPPMPAQTATAATPIAPTSAPATHITPLATTPTPATVPAGVTHNTSAPPITSVATTPPAKSTAKPTAPTFARPTAEPDLPEN